MNNFRIMYKILHVLEEAMHVEQFDHECISPTMLGIDEPTWKAIMKMLIDSGYIEGASIVNVLGGSIVTTKHAAITLKGLEYLQENSLMKKAADIAKGVADILS